ncbi:hypothetical protein [Eubacterium sp. AB3007]|uniref:hypothetical protein n=1 Tax=Eubacterium sp. AB3007 TaxID=1392487 RepID=UPI000480C878|nr:hypothetical protein [Eubacterium sp. AB3007]
MPLMVLGVVFVIGLFVYYLLSTSGSKDEPPAPPKPPKKDDIREEDNVIYLSDDIDKMKKNHRVER